MGIIRSVRKREIIKYHVETDKEIARYDVRCSPRIQFMNLYYMLIKNSIIG